MYELAPSRVLPGPNPFEVAPELDYRHEPRPEVPCYSETWFFSAWSPEQGVGVFIHAGADPEDATLWYAQVVAYLPDGELVIDRCWGRPADRGVLEVGNLRMTVDEPLQRWTLHFEGAGERTTTLKCGQGLIGSGPGVPLSFDVEVTAAGPVWDMFAASGLPELGWAGIHHEQNCWTRGRLAVGDRGWEIDGVGFRDHSNGARDIAGLGGASIHDNGTLEVINTDVTFTGIEDTAGNPAEIEMTLVRPGGERLVVPGRRLHNVTISISDPNHNMNGTYLEGDPLILSEAQARLDWPDGDVFYGHIETSSRLIDLKTA